MHRRYLLLPLLLAACDNTDVRDTLGLNRDAPDEFRVVSRPPLSVPPEFTLRPPADPSETDGLGAAISPRRDAQALLLNTDQSPALQTGTAETAIMPVEQQPLLSAADSTFLRNAGADNVDPTIRKQLYLEKPAEEQTMLEKLRDTSSGDPMVDAKAEAERLQTNREAGIPASSGDTPMIEPKDTGTLGRLLGY